MSLPSLRCPASELASEATPSWRSPSEQMTYVRWSMRSWPVAVELLRQPALGDGHAHGVRQPLAERAGRRLDAGREAVLRVAGRDRAPLAERLDVLEAHPVAREVEHRVQEHRRVAGAQHEAVAVRPGRVRRGVAEVTRPQRVGHRRHAHRRARVPGVRLLDAVDREGADRVDRQLVELVRGDGHRCLRGARDAGRDRRVGVARARRGAYGREGPS